MSKRQVVQLDIFTGKPPPARLLTPLEFHLHCALADDVRKLLLPSWRWTHLPFGEMRSPATGSRLKRMGVMPGWPDFMFVGPGRALLFIELKRGRIGKLSDEQLAVHQHLQTCGIECFVVRSVVEAIERLQAYGALRSIHVQ